jgi:hypothetical protein
MNKEKEDNNIQSNINQQNYNSENILNSSKKLKN